MRQRVDWVKIIDELDNREIIDHFFYLVRKLRKGKSMSLNRAAYCSLKKYYSTTTIDQLLEKVSQNG